MLLLWLRAHISPPRLDPVAAPETRYAKSGDVSIAYQVVGQGPNDKVFVPGFVSNLELGWQEPRWASFYEELANLGRLIPLDKRGTGLRTTSGVCRRSRCGWTTFERRLAVPFIVHVLLRS